MSRSYAVMLQVPPPLCTNSDLYLSPLDAHSLFCRNFIQQRIDAASKEIGAQKGEIMF